MSNRRPQMHVAVAGAIALASSACRTYPDHPLDRDLAPREFAARRLDSRDLAEFATALLPSGAHFPPQVWTVDTLTAAALYFHPELHLADAHLETARAAIGEASARANPRLSLTPERVGNASGSSAAWVLGAALEIPYELEPKRHLRVTRAELERDLAAVELAATAWKVESGVREAFVEREFARREAALMHANLELETRHVELLGKRFAAGEISRPDLSAAQLESARHELLLTELDARVAERTTDLARALGVPLEALAGLEFAPEIPDEAPPDVDLALRVGLLARSDLHRAALAFDLADVELRSAVLAQYPDLQFSPGYTWDQGEHKFALGVAFELPLFQRHGAEIDAAIALREERRAAFAATQTRAIEEIRAALEHHANAAIQLTRTQRVLDDFRSREARAEASFRAGELDALELSTARIERAAFERELLDRRRALEDALRDVENALERSLESLEPAPADGKPKP